MIEVAEHNMERETKLMSSVNNPNASEAEATADHRLLIQEFEPHYDWDHDDATDTLILMVPGFKKEQLKVQVTSNQVLRLSGERKISENKLRRFSKEILIPNSDIKGVTAKFKPGTLFVTLPKLVSPTIAKPEQPTITDRPQQKDEKEEATKKTPQKKDNDKKYIGPPVDQQSPKEKKAAEPKSEAQTSLDSQKQENGKKEDTEAHFEAIDQQSPKSKEAAKPKSEAQTKTNEEDSQKKENAEKEEKESVVDQKSPKVEEDVKHESELQTRIKRKKKLKRKEETQIMPQEPNVNEEYYEEKKENGKKEGEGKKSLSTLKMLSRQTQEYKSEFPQFVEKVKNRKILCNLVFLVFLLLFGIYLNNVFKSLNV